MWPQYTYLVISILGVGIAIAQHGQPRTGNHSFWTHLIGVGIGYWLLYMGGFFGGLR